MPYYPPLTPGNLSELKDVLITAPVLNQVLKYNGTEWVNDTDAPVFVNPGEFIQVVKKKVGTAPSAGVIAHVVTFIYGWE